MERATATYEGNLTSVLSYLESRGITEATARAARLGAVISPEPGHESFVGRLSIPYIDMMGVYGLKFRCLLHDDCKEEGCKSKYLHPVGQETSIYGVVDADSSSPVAHITEGEFDRLIIKQVFDGEPALGIPGTQNWKPFFPFLFAGFERVVVWPDGDKAGEDLANRITRAVRSAEVMPMPRGMDVTSFYVERGAEALRALSGEDEETE